MASLSTMTSSLNSTALTVSTATSSPTEAPMWFPVTDEMGDDAVWSNYSPITCNSTQKVSPSSAPSSQVLSNATESLTTSLESITAVPSSTTATTSISVVTESVSNTNSQSATSTIPATATGAAPALATFGAAGGSDTSGLVMLAIFIAAMGVATIGRHW